MARVLLLNPPSTGRPKLRDFACGESTKADYYWAPIDLLVLSGLLRGHHDIHVLDAVVEGLSFDEALARATAARPDVVFTLTAAVTLDEDERFLTALVAATRARVYGSGDVAAYAPEATLSRTSSFDGLLQNFADPSLRWLADGDESRVTSVVLRRGEGWDARPVVRQEPMRYDVPLHGRFPLSRYRMPFTRWTGSTSVVSAYGCPYPCTFCASGRLPWQVRPVSDVVDELRHVEALGLREFYMRDFTFGPTRRRARELARAMTDAGLSLRWSAECRLDVLDEETLTAMREAGCEVILVGVETGTEAVARRLGKQHAPARSERLLRFAQEIGIRTCGHFVLGTPDETREELEATLRLATSLSLDYASFNLYAPRLGSVMRDDLVRDGRVDPAELGSPDVSLRADAHAAVPAAELEALFRRAVLTFYFRPTQVTRLLRNTPWSVLLRQGAGVLGLLRETES